MPHHHPCRRHFRRRHPPRLPLPPPSPPPPVASQDHATRQEHRAYIRDEVRFKQVVPFSDDKVLPRIHLNFRIAFLRDALLPQDLEDATW